MRKNNIIYCCILSTSLCHDAFSLGVGVDTVQAKPSVTTDNSFEIASAKNELIEKQKEITKLKSLLHSINNAIVAKVQKDNNVRPAPYDFLALKKDDDLSKLDEEELTEKLYALETALNKAQTNEREAKDTLKNAEQNNKNEGKVAVDPQIAAGESEPSASINLRYTYGFKYSMFLTSAVDIGPTRNDTADKLAAGFAINGGNVDFSLKYGYTKEFDGIDGTIRVTPTLGYTYSGVSASELDLQAGGATDIDTEVQSATLGLTTAFGSQYFLGIDHSYHDVSEKQASEFAALLDQKRTTVVRAIFAMDKSAKRLLVLERAHPIGNESAQLRLSFITSLAF